MKKSSQRYTFAIALVLTVIAATAAPVAMALLGSPHNRNRNNNNNNAGHMAFQVRHRLQDEGEPGAADWFDEEGVDELHSLQEEDDEDDIFPVDENETDDNNWNEMENENTNDDGGVDLNTILSAFESVNVSFPDPETMEAGGEDAVVAVQPQEKPADASFFDLTGGSVRFMQCHAPQSHNAAVNTATARQQRNYPAMVTFQMCLGAFAENSSGSTRTTPNHDITTSTCEQTQHDCQHYVMDLETYLQSSIRHQEDNFQDGCDACKDKCPMTTPTTSSPTTTSPVEESNEFIFTDEEDIVTGALSATGSATFEPTDASMITDTFSDVDFRWACDWCADSVSDAEENNCWPPQSVTERYSPVVTLPVDCDRCSSECQDEVIDAQVFLQCELIYDNGAEGQLFAGPACHIMNEKQITLAVFKDEDCQDIILDQNVDSYIFDSDGLQMKVSYAKLQSTVGRSVSCFVDAPMLTPESDNNGNTTLEINDMCRSLKAEAFSCQDGTLGDGYSDVASTEDPASYQWMKAYCPPGSSPVVADDTTENTVEATEDVEDIEDAATSESDKGQQQQEDADIATETASTEGNLAENDSNYTSAENDANNTSAPVLSAANAAKLNSLWVGSVLGVIGAALLC